jgi:hypothetical protein
MGLTIDKESPMHNWTREESDKILRLVSEKAAMDLEFRKLVLENPAEAISRVAGKPLRDGFKIKVIDNDPAYDMTYVLPPYMSNELTDREQEEVVGGVDFCVSYSNGECWVFSM